MVPPSLSKSSISIFLMFFGDLRKKRNGWGGARALGPSPTHFFLKITGKPMENQWKWMKIIDLKGFLALQINDFHWFSLIFIDFPWFSLIFVDFRLFSLIFHDFRWFSFKTIWKWYKTKLEWPGNIPEYFLKSCWSCKTSQKSIFGGPQNWFFELSTSIFWTSMPSNCCSTA